MSDRRLEFAEVKAVAQARILDVLHTLDIHGRVNGVRGRQYISICSPVGDREKNPSFTVWVSGPAAGCFKDFRGYGAGDVFDLVAYVRGWSTGNDGRGKLEALKWLADVLGLARLADDERDAMA